MRSLAIHQYKMFDEEVEVRFRPLTFLIGYNNTGKSTVFSALQRVQSYMNRRGPEGVGAVDNVDNSVLISMGDGCHGPYLRANGTAGECVYSSFQRLFRLGADRVPISGMLGEGAIWELNDWVGSLGENTMGVLKGLLRSDNGRLGLLNRYLELVMGMRDVEDQDCSLSDSHAVLAERVSVPWAMECRTGTSVSFSDMGSGLSSVLPVLVQGCALDAGDRFLVEHPERCVHETAQLELGSFFADLWRERGVMSVVETHSMNILLRIRRLVNNGALRPDDVSVTFFDIVEDQATVRNLDIDEDGRLLDGPPMSFFGASIIEGLNLGAEGPPKTNGRGGGNESD